MRSRSCMLVTLAGLAATPACSKILGIDGDVTLRDAGRPPNTVIGRVYAHGQTAAGGAEYLFDLSQAIIQALIADPTQASGYRVSVGTGNADGTFTIPEVPEDATYLLKLVSPDVGPSSYFETTLHELDYHLDYPIRLVPFPTQASSGTKVSFDVQGMTPFVEGPEEVDDSIRAGSLTLGGPHEDISVPNNAQSLTVLHAWNEWLPDAALGDDFLILHTRTSPILSIQGRKQRVTRVIDTFMPPGITIANGTTTNINGSWTAATPNKSIDLSIARGAFDGGYDGDTEFSGMSVELWTHPVAGGTSGVQLFEVRLNDWSRSGSLDENLSFEYSDPFPASWSRTIFLNYSRNRGVQVPNAPLHSGAYAGNVRAFPYTSGNPVTIPVLQPPAGFQVAGKEASAGGLVSFDRTSPVELKWSPVSAAKQYTVRVNPITEGGSPGPRLVTTQTSIRIPAEVFTGAEFFMFVVSAVRSPTDHNAGQLLANGIPNDEAGTMSGMFRLSDRCGNGTVDAGEACDTAGESATCDIDCTLPLCGDGLRNAATGEVCDAGGRDASGCDRDCTLPICGDGYRNYAVEDCDDGNTTDSDNGCSSNCRYNNVCGDGVVQQLVEQCDPGPMKKDTATCDYDCTVPVCGDGHRNAAAGEPCDDDNSDDTDGCTSVCTTM